MGALVLFAVRDPLHAAIWVSIGTLAGGVAQLALVWWAVRKTGFLPRFRLPKFDKDVRRFWWLALPAIASGGITQINIFIGTIIASGAAGAISYLYYADRLYQLPLGIIGIAIGVVLLPELSRHLKGGRETEARAALDKSLLLAMLLSVPAAAGLMALGEPIIRVLFERGAFGPEATHATAIALFAFASGLPAFVLIKLFQPGFFARENTRTPTIFAGISVIVNIGISLALFPQFAHLGIAIATSVSAWINAFFLASTLMRQGHFALSVHQIIQQVTIVLTAIVLALGLWLGAESLASNLTSDATLTRQSLTLAGLIFLGFVGYFTTIHLTGVQNLRTLFKGLLNSSAK